MFAHVIYNDIWYFATASRPPHFGIIREKTAKSPVGIRGHSCADTRGQCGGSKKGAGDLVDRCRSCACNCVVATVTSLVTSAMQYSEVRLVCVASEHCSRRRCRASERRREMGRGENTGDDANAGGRSSGEDNSGGRMEESREESERDVT